MTTRQFTLVSKQFDDPHLRTISDSDRELLREWKNAHRNAFFFQGIISPEDQARWFLGYRARENDWMFMVIASGQPVGCMGFRLLESGADIYNVILGNPEMGKRGLMRRALRLMCSFCIASAAPDISAQVLRDNSAVAWYDKAGFRKIAEHDTYFDLKLDLQLFRPCEFVSRP